MISARAAAPASVATHRSVALGLLALIAVNAAPFVNSAATTSSAASCAQLAILTVALCSRSWRRVPPQLGPDLPANRFLQRPLSPGPGLALRDLAGALISFGPCVAAALREALTRRPFRDRAYLRALDRRNRILIGRPFVMPILPSPERALLPGSA